MRIKFWLGVLISGVFLYFFARQIEWLEVWWIVKAIHYEYIFIAALLQMLVYVVRAKRWRYLLMPLKDMGFYSVFSATIIGFMGNNIFPARLGEIIRAYIIGKREGVSKTASMATIVLERLFDGFCVLCILIGLLWFFPFPPGFENNEIVNSQNLKLAGYVSGGLYFAIILFLVVAKLHSQQLLSWLGKIMVPRFASVYNRIVNLTESFVSGLDSLKRGKHIFAIIIDSILVWFAIAVVVYSLYPAFELPLAFNSAVLVVVVTALIVAIPSSPGFVGTFHFACATCLILLGVEPNKAKSFAIILHLVVFIPVTLLGLLFVYQENLNLKELQAMENEA